MQCPRCGTDHAPDLARCPACGAATPTWIDEDGTKRVRDVGRRMVGTGASLGPYTLLERIGEGGMSAVYAARDQALDREVAVKILHPNLVGDEGIRRRFLREGRIMSGFSHPNIVTVLDTVSSNDIVALVMERVQGATLAEVLTQWRGGLPFRELGQVAVGLLSGLSAAHARGVVHRDLKPGNVLIEVHNGTLVPRIIDFGIARVLEGTTYTLTGAVLGTCRYMSPEQVRGEPVDPRSDLYAFGVVLYELATGRPPFADAQPFAVMMAHTSKVPASPRDLRPDLPEVLVRTITACLAKVPHDRPPTAAGLARELAAALSVDAPKSRPRQGGIGNHHDLILVDEGEFLMGTEKRQVWLSAFTVDRRPVTNAQFHAFVRATGYRPDDAARFVAHWPTPDGPSGEQRNQPVVFVDHADATAYAGWVGLRLPTEAEWEKAARGTDGRRFPWGSAPPTPDRAWFGRRTGPGPVDGRPEGASPYGVHDMVGNVWEWCSDGDDERFVREGPTVDPRLPLTSEHKEAVARGGAWIFDAPKALRTTTRMAFAPDERRDTLGFRCAG